MFSIPQEIKTQTSYVSNRLISLGFLDLDDSIALSSHLLRNISQSSKPTKNQTALTPTGRNKKNPPLNSSTPRSKTTTSPVNSTDAVSPVIITQPAATVDTAASNDLKVLNIISSLLSAIESDKQTRNTLLQKVESARKEHEIMEANLKHIEAKNEGLQRQLDSISKLNRYAHRNIFFLNLIFDSFPSLFE